MLLLQGGVQRGYRGVRQVELTCLYERLSAALLADGLYLCFARRASVLNNGGDLADAVPLYENVS